MDPDSLALRNPVTKKPSFGYFNQREVPFFGCFISWVSSFGHAKVSLRKGFHMKG